MPSAASIASRSESAVCDESSNKQFIHDLISDHQQDVWRYLRALGCSCDLADDLTQETFLVALRRPFKYLGPKAAAAYLRRSAYHRFLSHVQQAQKKRATELTPIAVNNETWHRWCGEQKDSSAVLDALKECLVELPQRDRYALEMRFRDGLSRKEIAARLSMSEHGAKNLMQRAKKRLRAALECRLVQSEVGR